MNQAQRSYDELDLNELLEDIHPSVDEILTIKWLKQRTLFLNSDIDAYSVGEIVKHILQYNTDDIGQPVDERAPIRLYISSLGGDVDSGFELIDVIKASVTPVYTINMSYNYSMAFLISIAGHKRFCTENATYLLHDGLSCIVNSGGKAKDQMDFQSKYEERIKAHILASGNMDAETYDREYRKEWYMFGDEAKKYGFVDYIIGKNCSLESILCGEQR